MPADLPLVSDEKLLEYGHRITQGHPLSDDVISFAIVEVLYDARAKDLDAQWVDGQLSRYIPADLWWGCSWMEDSSKSWKEVAWGAWSTSSTTCNLSTSTDMGLSWFQNYIKKYYQSDSARISAHLSKSPLSKEEHGRTLFRGLDAYKYFIGFNFLTRI